MVSNVVSTSLVAGYLYLSFLNLHFTCLFHSQSFQKSSPTLLQVLQPLISVVVDVRFITNRMCVKNNTHVARTSRCKMSTTWDLYCCLVRQWEALRDSGKLCALAARPFQSQQSGALTRMWMWCQVQPSQKERAIGAVHCKNEGMLFRLLRWRCIESAVFACPIHENDQRWTCTWI